MKGGMRLLLIAILATAATAKYEFDSQQAERLVQGIQSLKIHEVKFNDTKAPVEWKFMEDNNQAILFEANNWRNSLGNMCEGLPTLVIDDGVLHCLSKMLFKSVIVNGKESLKLSLIFHNSKEHEDWKILLSDLFKNPENGNQQAAVIPVEPITKAQVASVRDKKSFAGSASWIDELVKAGIYSLELKSTKKSREVYIAKPTIMDAETLDEVLELLSKKTQNDANVEKSPNDANGEKSQNNNGEITDQLSVKQLVDFWITVGKQ